VGEGKFECEGAAVPSSAILVLVLHILRLFHQSLLHHRSLEKMPDSTGSKNPSEGRKTRAGTAMTLTRGNNFDMHNALEGRKFLEKHLLLSPPGEPITYMSFTTCLHQISNITGVAKTAANTIWAIALLADEFEETAINKTVRNAVNT